MSPATPPTGTGGKSRAQNGKVLTALQCPYPLTGNEKVPKRLVGKRARLSTSKVIHPFRERCEGVKASRGNRALTVDERDDRRARNEAAELWVDAAESKRIIAARRQAQRREAESTDEHESGRGEVGIEGSGRNKGTTV